MHKAAYMLVHPQHGWFKILIATRGLFSWGIVMTWTCMRKVYWCSQSSVKAGINHSKSSIRSLFVLPGYVSLIWFTCEGLFHPFFIWYNFDLIYTACLAPGLCIQSLKAPKVTQLQLLRRKEEGMLNAWWFALAAPLAASQLVFLALSAISSYKSRAIAFFCITFFCVAFFGLGRWLF